MPYIATQDVLRAKKMDLLTYLQENDPQELVHVSGNTYCTREHDSLRISNGKWHWFSKGIGGKSALDYLIKVKGLSFLDAAEQILQHPATVPLPTYTKAPLSKELRLPAKSPSNGRVIAYLMQRKLHPVIIQWCLSHNLLYESLPYHNAVFVGYDGHGTARYAALRGTFGNFKGDAPGSDKRFCFSLAAREKAEDLHLFESAIDLLSFASLERMAGRAWRKDNLLSLGGVYGSGHTDTLPLSLQQFLTDHPETHVLHLHLDNDEPGRNATKSIMRLCQDRFVVLDEPPETGKDMNDTLLTHKEALRSKESPER